MKYIQHNSYRYLQHIHISMRIRQSIQRLQYLYDTGEDKTQLENLVKAFREIQKRDPEDDSSFYALAGYHGEPHNFCNHGNVLFPTWHRAYLLKLENALRSVEGCGNVTMPFWDETFLEEGAPVVPSIFTNPKFPFDSNEDNPLYSYRLQKGIIDEKSRYTKKAGYETVRYPLSGLVGTPADVSATAIHNERYKSTAVQYLSHNIEAWMKGTVDIDRKNDGGADTPDTYSTRARFERCLDAPNYTVFSNNNSVTQWIKEKCSGGDTKEYHVSLESPHNAMHLAIGGFYQYADYNADEIRGANGDMGANEVAAYDPIFYFHHAFIDLVFWLWQRKHGRTQAGSLDVITGYDGASVQARDSSSQPLDMNSPLTPFKHDDSHEYYTSNDVTDIENQLGYNYAPSSLEHLLRSKLGFQAPEAPIVKIKRVHDISRADYSGSFVIRTFAMVAGNKVEIGREPILSRLNVGNCANCRNKLKVESLVAIDEKSLQHIEGDTYWSEIQVSSGLGNGRLGFGIPPRAPIVDDLF